VARALVVISDVFSDFFFAFFLKKKIVDQTGAGAKGRLFSRMSLFCANSTTCVSVRLALGSFVVFSVV
jgi:hypothetical protein